MKVVGGREILANLVAVKLNLIAEMIRKEKEKEKQNSRHQVRQKKLKSFKLQAPTTQSESDCQIG